MIEIKDLLIGWGNILLSEEGKKEAVRGAIFKTANLKISSKDIKIKNNTVYLNLKPIYKNEIFLKQKQIFFELEKLLGKKTPKNIR